MSTRTLSSRVEVLEGEVETLEGPQDQVTSFTEEVASLGGGVSCLEEQNGAGRA